MTWKLVGEQALQRRLKAIGRDGRRELLESLQRETIAEAKANVPRKTGHLGRSIVRGRISGNSAEVIANAGYAAYVEYGTRPHVITPKRARVLAWPANAGGRRLTGRPRAGAAMRFSKRVNHPGTKPQPFLLPAGRSALHKAGIQSIVKPWNDAA